MKKIIVFIFCSFAFYNLTFAQSGNLTGVISDEQGLAVPFASIIVTGSNKGTVSDTNGKFLILNVPPGKQTILVEYLGYADQEIEVDVKENNTIELNVLLKTQSEELKGVILTG